MNLQPTTSTPGQCCCDNPDCPERRPVKVNAIRCDQCRMVIESTYRHDFKSCRCGRVCVDGGHDYHKTLFTTDGGPMYTRMTRAGAGGPWIEADVQDRDYL